MWWHTPVIPTLAGIRQENHEFKASLGYRACLIPAWTTACLKKQNRVKQSKAKNPQHIGKWVEEELNKNGIEIEKLVRWILQ